MRERCPGLADEAISLLEEMLTMNPLERCDAKAALAHPWFATEPLPCDLSQMPVVEKESHVLGIIEERKQSHDHLRTRKKKSNPNANDNINHFTKFEQKKNF